MPRSNERSCSNCNEKVKVTDAIIIQKNGRVVAVLCADCQQAKKISVTLVRGAEGWEFAQYFPVEA